MQLRPSGYGRQWAWASLVAMPLLLLLLHVALGLRPEHFVIAGAFLALAWAGPRARRFSALAAPFVATGLAYDFLRLFIHLRGPIHVGDLFEAERALFGIHMAQGTVALSELFAHATHPALDVIFGAAYILYLPQVFGMGAVLYFRNQQRMQRLAWSFALASFLGWAIWILWPAAPPWYVDLYGTGPAILTAPSSPAGAARFDAFFGIHLFASFYSRSSNIFGAMPSLHVGYAVLPALAVWSLGGWTRRLTCVWAVVMSFAAVYLRHHYILDVIAGAAVAVTADGVVRASLRAGIGLEERQRGVSTEVSA